MSANEPFFVKWDNRFTFHGDITADMENGSFATVRDIEGLTDQPNVERKDDDVGDYAPRVIRQVGQLVAPSLDEISRLWQEILGMMRRPDREFLYAFNDHGRHSHLRVRPDGNANCDFMRGKKDADTGDWVVEYSVPLSARYPYRLSGLTGAPTKDIKTGAGGSGSLTFSNDGTGDFPPTVIELIGAHSNPTISAHGRTMHFPINVSNSLVLDVRARTVKADGVNVRPVMRETQSSDNWIELWERTTNTVSYDASGSPYMRVKTFDSYL